MKLECHSWQRHKHDSNDAREWVNLLISYYCNRKVEGCDKINLEYSGKQMFALDASGRQGVSKVVGLIFDRFTLNTFRELPGIPCAPKYDGYPL